MLATDLDGKLPVNHLNYGGDALPSQPIVAAMGNQIFWVQGDLHGDIVTRTKRSITTKGEYGLIYLPFFEGLINPMNLKQLEWCNV